MLKNIRLTNYRQHRSRVFDMTTGLNVLRGANEKGKSTLLESVIYAFFGTRSVSESLSDIVTYGEPEASLKVEVDFEIDGVEYTMVRSKNGAELTYGGDGRVTGQNDTRAFMEKILQASSDVCKTLMFAEQNSIRGVLEDKAEAGELIEKLAELDVIDTLIEKLTSQHPTGATKAQEQTLTRLELSRVNPKPADPSRLTVAQNAKDSADAQLVEANRRVAELTPEKEAAEREIARGARLSAQAEQQAVYAEKLLAVPDPGECPVTDEQIEAVQKAAVEHGYLQAALSAYGTKFPKVEYRWKGAWENLLKEIQKQQVIVDQASAQFHEAKSQLAVIKFMDVNSSKCPTCGSEVKNPADIEKHNDEARKLQTQWTIDRDEATRVKEAATQTLEKMRAIQATQAQIEKLADARYWTLDDAEGYPATPVWIKEIPQASAAKPDPAPLVKKQKEWIKARSDYDNAVEQLANMQPIDVPEVHTHKAFLDGAWKQASEALTSAKALVATTESSVKIEQAVYDKDDALYLMAVNTAEKLEAEIDAMKKMIADMEFNNQLIKDLRGARLTIRNKLWSTVMSAVSFYFSAIRKVPTVVTRGDRGFMQNGRPVEGLSGSAKDMLGLAIRAALVKTFLPGSTLLVLDEPFSGCDEAREVSGLGVLASLQFEQTILVTHSDLADAVADSIVQL